MVYTCLLPASPPWYTRRGTGSPGAYHPPAGRNRLRKRRIP